MPFFQSVVAYKNQSYAALKAECQKEGTLFSDAQFPANEKALFTSAASDKLTGIEWKRPKDICENPQLFVEGADSNDVSQGALGNCWFVAASSCLAGDKDIWSKVIPNHKEQEWDAEKPEEYAGIFHFRFWRYGEWIDVVVDDLLPTRNGSLVYVHSKSKNEFWSALLEKAYAKINGCYEALDGGELAEALEDFTGGISEPVDLANGQYTEDEEKKEALYKIVKNAFENKALMAAAIPAKSSDEMEQSTDIGLVKGHAYGITLIKRIALEGSGVFNLFNKEKLSMVRLRNPWGGSEWKGAFSDGSEEWNRIDKASREKIGLTFDDDGEFWMTFDDFCTYFTNMSICRVVNTSMFRFTPLQKKWHEGIWHSEWRTPGRAGGCINNKETFLQNPQFIFDITEDSDEILIGLMQKVERAEADSKKLTMGYTIMKVEENRAYRLHSNQEVVKSSTFKNSRCVFLRHTLPKGRYVVICCTFEPGFTSKILLRLYTGASSHIRELIDDRPEKSLWNTIFGTCGGPCAYPSIVTRVKVLRAVGLEKQDTVGGSDPYVYLKCEREYLKSPTVADTLSPEFNFAGVFYRRQPVKKPIKIQIWNSNTIKDDFMGQYILDARQEMKDKVIEVPLVGRKDEKSMPKPGKLFLQVTTSHDLSTV